MLPLLKIGSSAIPIVLGLIGLLTSRRDIEVIGLTINSYSYILFLLETLFLYVLRITKRETNLLVFEKGVMVDGIFYRFSSTDQIKVSDSAISLEFAFNTVELEIEDTLDLLPKIKSKEFLERVAIESQKKGRINLTNRLT